MTTIREECYCMQCGNEADLVINCDLLDIEDPDRITVLPKDRDVQVLP